MGGVPRRDSATREALDQRPDLCSPYRQSAKRVGEEEAGIGSESRRLSGKIGLGAPPLAESNPLRLKIALPEVCRLIWIGTSRTAADSA
jgi:hypothetical protein